MLHVERHLAWLVTQVHVTGQLAPVFDKATGIATSAELSTTW